MNALDVLHPRYSVILCDVWGVIHDGVRLYPGAAERLRGWRQEGRKVILITNAPRSADAVEAQLRWLGLSGDHWDGISTSGEAGMTAIEQLSQAAGFLGTSGGQHRVGLADTGSGAEKYLQMPAAFLLGEGKQRVR